MMRRIAQAPRTEHDGPIPSGVHVERRVRVYGRVMIVLAGCSLVLLTTILWSLRPPEPQRLELGRTHRSRNPGFLFPLYRHHRQLHNSTHGSGFLGRRIRSSDSQALFGLQGGGRISDDGLEIEDLYIIVELGDAEFFHFHVDTASGPVSWVYCNDFRGYESGPLKKWGPNGMFVPSDHSVKCKGRTASVCRTFQKNARDQIKCDRVHHFDCLFALKYLDDTSFLGRVVNESITLPMIDNTKRKIPALFGCVYETAGVTVARQPISDGIIALGNCEGTLMDQLWRGKHISRNVLVVCLVKEMVKAPPVGFISLGMDFEEKFGNSVPNWVKMQSKVNVYCAYGAKLLHIFVDQKRITVRSLPIEMYIDTGSDLTYLQKSVYVEVVKALDTYAKNRAYDRKVDNENGLPEEQRMCWEPPSKKRKTHGKSKPRSSPIDDFGPLKFGFEGMNEAAPVQYLIIQPENYLAWDEDEIKLCVNILQDTDNSLSNLGADMLRGNLFVFDVENQRFRWTASTNCDT